MKIAKPAKITKTPIRNSHAKKVTLEMVASACGVSPSTVSRILNGTAVVSPKKREAVDRAIAALGFVPNPVARGLAGGRTLSIGVVTQAIDSPFYGVSLRGIEEELGHVGYSPLFVSAHWNADEEKRCIDVLLSRRVDGLIILTGRLNDEALRRFSKVAPVVVTGRDLSGPNLHSLNFNNFKGAQLATHHLLSLGHRRIAFIAGDLGHPDAIERMRGYRTALKSAGITSNNALVLPGNYLEESGQMAAERLIDSREEFSAIFAANDQMAFGAALALHRRGIRVPDDVSLVGFDDQAGAAHSIPPLTTIHQGALELGQIAASCLLQMLAGQTPTAVMQEPRLVIRGSTRSLAAA
jgi:LacI family transcriptional regulator